MFALFKKNKRQNKMFSLALLSFLIFFANSVHAINSEQKLTIDSKRVIYLVNSERSAKGLQELIESDLLNAVAEKKLNSMLEDDYFAHTSPDGTGPWEWFFHSGYDFAYAGENLATKFKTTKEQHEAWMNSPTHKKNILDEKFTNTGVAVGEREFKGKKVFVTVQVFATPKKYVVKSPNFTPETFVMPDELFLAGSSVGDENIDIYQESMKELSKAEILNAEDIGNSFLQENSPSREIAWWIISIITIFIIIVEYRIFSKKSKK